MRVLDTFAMAVLHSDAISSLEIGNMVELVASGDVGPRPRTAGVASHRAAPQPGLGVEAA